MSQRFEIWTIAQKWMTLNKNVKRRRKNQKRQEKDEKNEKDENKKLN